MHLAYASSVHMFSSHFGARRDYASLRSRTRPSPLPAVSRPEAAEEDPVLTLEQALDGREGKASALHADERRRKRASRLPQMEPRALRPVVSTAREHEILRDAE